MTKGKTNKIKKEEKIQYWQNGIMRGLVTKQEAEEIKRSALEQGFQIHDNGHYFSVETNTGGSNGGKKSF